MNSFDGLRRAFLHHSVTTGMNIATTGVLFRNALKAVTGRTSRSCASSVDLRHPEHALRDHCDRAGFREAGRHDEQYGDGEQPFVAEPRPDLGGVGNRLESTPRVMTTVAAPMMMTSVDATFLARL